MSSYFHSASQSCSILSANCRHNLRLFRFFFAAIVQVWINFHRRHVFYTVMLWQGSQVPCSLGNIRKRTKKRPWRKRQSRSWRCSFHKYFTTCFYLFLFSIYFTLSFFFLYVFYPRHLPTPTPTKRCMKGRTYNYVSVKVETRSTWHLISTL